MVVEFKVYEKLEYGFIAYTGVQWTDLQVDNYNALVQRINAFNGDVPEYLLNSKHKLFWMYSQPV